MSVEPGQWLGHVGRGLLLLLACHNAYDIRMYAIRTHACRAKGGMCAAALKRRYGNVIHEFDPWFNYRATEYLAANGWHAFFHWFDYMSWYPLGRPVGTTIYPGMQITAVAIWRALGKLGSAISLNDVCCLVPAWLGVLEAEYALMYPK